MSNTLSRSKRERGLSLETLQHKRASSSLQGRISWFAWNCGRKLRVTSSCVSTWGIHLCLLREVRSPLALQGEPRESSHIIAGMNRASSRVEAGTQGSSPFLISILASLRSWNRVVRPRLVCCGNTRDSLSSPWYLERKIKPPAATRDKPRDATVNAR